MSDILSCLQQHVLTSPEKAFVLFYGDDDEVVSISYGALWARSRSYAAHLAQLGVEPGSVVMIMLRHTPDLYSAFLGAMMYGAIPSFMPPPTAKQRPDIFWSAHERLFAQIEPAVFIAHDDLQPMLAAILHRSPLFVNPEKISDEGFFEFIAPNPSNIAFLQHSSGTTGTKKGVMLSHRAVLAQVAHYAPTIGLNGEAIIASWLPLYHDMGLIACFMAPLITGATIAHMDPLDWSANPLKLLDIIEKYRATHCWLPNFAFNHMAMNRRLSKHSKWDLSSLIAIINCSEPCKVESMDLFEQRFEDCALRRHIAQTCYAMAENVFAVSQSRPGEEVKRLSGSADALLSGRYRPAEPGETSRTLASCGQIITGTEVKILTHDENIAEDGHIGEICIRGESLFNGYNRLPDLNDRKIRDGWYYTGDMGFLWDEDVYITGRIDDLIIVRGRNYYAHDIEAIVNSVSGIKPGRCVVFPRENPNSGTTDAICLAETTGIVDPTDLRREVKRVVEALSGLVLAKLEIFPEGTLIKTTSGKISREANSSLLRRD